MRKSLITGFAAAALAVGAVACAPPAPSVPRPDNTSPATAAGTAVPSWTPAMTPDGRYVAFVSTFPDIVPGFAPPRATVYRWDRVTGTTVAVSVSPTGDPSNESGTLFPPTPESVDISADGRFVAFTSQATNLTSDPVPGNRYEVFVRDVVAGTTTLVSTSRCV